LDQPKIHGYIRDLQVSFNHSIISTRAAHTTTLSAPDRAFQVISPHSDVPAIIDVASDSDDGRLFCNDQLASSHLLSRTARGGRRRIIQ
jgi:hypothetical protein